MIDILIRNARVIDPANNLDEVTDIAIADGKIASIGSICAQARECIDATGKILCPGLVDLHVHCREPGHEEEETIATASHTAVAGGFTTILAMGNTHPPTDNETAIQYFKQRSERANLTKVLPVGTITIARKGKVLAEMGAMLEAGAVAFSDDGDGVESSQVMQRAMQYAKMLDVPLLQHCQDPALFGGSMNSGPIAVRMGLGGIAVSGEEIMLQRDIELLKRTGGRYHVQHVSSEGSVELIRRAKAMGLDISAEATPHHLLLTDASCITYDPNYKVNPPLRSASDVEAVRAGVADGTITCLATDHAPHSAEEKELEFALAPFGIISLEIAVGLYAKALIETHLMDWPCLISRMSTNPAAVIGLPAGDISKGSPADITIIDPTTKWTVDVNTFASKSKNCPYHSWELTARVVTTIVDGKIKFQL